VTRPRVSVPEPSQPGLGEELDETVTPTLSDQAGLRVSCKLRLPSLAEEAHPELRE